jgi:hypothetical protein
MQWMSGVTRWNAVILLGPTDNATDILEVLNTLDGSDDMIMQEGTYTFSRQSVDAKKVVAYGPHKLHFRVVGGILYVMRYPKDADWRPSAAQGSDGEWPTSWIKPTKAWEPTEWNVPVMEVPGHNVKGKNVESSPQVVIEEAAAHGNDQTMNLESNSAGGGESSAYAGHSGEEDHVAANAHEKDVTNVPIVDASSVQGTELTDSTIGTTKLGSSVGKDQDSISTISALTYVVEGDYSTDRLDRMWVQQQPKDDIDALDRERWGMFNGTYFRRIELSELLERQSSEATPKTDTSSTGMHDAVSSLLMMASASSTVEMYAGYDVERVLETPPE